MPFHCIHIENYKRVVTIVSIVIIIVQIARISVIGHESTPAYYFYPQTHTLVFCITSIFLGVLSIGLEAMLLWSLKERKICGIQPWFLTTFVIFLFASLAFAITLSLYIIRPLDHNLKVQNELLNNKGMLIDHSIQNDKSHKPKHVTPNVTETPMEQLTSHIIKSLNTFVHHDEKQELVENESVVLNATLNGTEIFSEIIPLVYNRTKCSKKELTLQMEFYSVRPLLTLSFLFDVVRSFPQLYLVNKYVKSERLHHMHYHSHGSLATLYIKDPLK